MANDRDRDMSDEPMGVNDEDIAGRADEGEDEEFEEVDEMDEEDEDVE